MNLSKQLSGLHCHVISYVFISHYLTLSSSLRRRIGELNPLGDDHLILRGGWHFLEINILTLKMLEINNLSSSAKKINNLT